MEMKMNETQLPWHAASAAPVAASSVTALSHTNDVNYEN